MMFYGDGDQVTLDRNYIHDCSGRAPKLGEDDTSGTFVRHTAKTPKDSQNKNANQEITASLKQPLL